MRTVILVFSATAVLGACASSWREQVVALPDEILPTSGFSWLTLIPTDNPTFAYRALAERVPAVLSVWSTDETAVRDACGARRPFYGDPERRNLEPAWRCFCFTRFVNRDDDAPAFDFVGQLRLGDSGDYVQGAPAAVVRRPGSRARPRDRPAAPEIIWAP